MTYSEIQLPKLIDFQTGQYLTNTLRQCHENRVYTYSWVLNVTVVLVFVLIGFLTLYLCYRRKKTPEEFEAKIQMEQKMILDKIRGLREQKQKYFQEESYTQLPFVDSSV
jgi:F0F1-type ATP synthase membrane subunit a